ncbi:hypothetical protein BDAP_001168 [Binucleata daphniae]
MFAMEIVDKELTSKNELLSSSFGDLASHIKYVEDSPQHGSVEAFTNQNNNIQCVSQPNPINGCYYQCETSPTTLICPGQPNYQPPQGMVVPKASQPQPQQQQQNAPQHQQNTQQQPAPIITQQPKIINQQPLPISAQPITTDPNINKNIICPPKPYEQEIKDIITPDFNPSPNAVKRITTVTVSKGDAKSPIQKIKDIDPELGKQIEKILDYNGITEPWSAYEDLVSPKQHQMPDWCNMYKKVRSMFKVFESLKELISEEFLNIQRFTNRGKVYMREYADELKKNLDRMILDLKKMKVARDYSTKDEYMRKFNLIHCKTQETIIKYKKLRSWLLNTVKVFSRMFYPFNVSRVI